MKGRQVIIKEKKEKEGAASRVRGLRNDLLTDIKLYDNHAKYFTQARLVTLFMDDGSAAGIVRSLCRIRQNITDLLERIDESERETSDD